MLIKHTACVPYSDSVFKLQQKCDEFQKSGIFDRVTIQKLHVTKANAQNNLV